MTTRFGVNYIPAKDWLYSWVEWDRAAIGDDLAAIAALGLDHVRVHLLWPLFQPNPSFVSPTMLRRLVDLLDLCAEHGLDAQVTALNGWMSGFLFRPSWMGEGRSFYTDPTARRGATRLLAEVAGAIRDHPAALGVDIGNELSVLADFGPPGEEPGDADTWAEQLLATCEERMPGGLHCNGVDHRPWLTPGAPFTRRRLAVAGALTVVHSWPYFTGAFERYGTQDHRALHIGEFMVELANAHAADPAREVWAQEIGLSEQWVAADRIEAAAAHFVGATASAGNLWGVTWWCSHDVDRRFEGFEPLEHDLGLLTVDNAVKPLGAAVAAAVREARTAAAPARTTAIAVPAGTPALELMDRFVDLRRSGTAPTFVLEDLREDAGHLTGRGVLEVVDAVDV